MVRSVIISQLMKLIFIVVLKIWYRLSKDRMTNNYNYDIYNSHTIQVPEAVPDPKSLIRISVISWIGAEILPPLGIT